MLSYGQWKTLDLSSEGVYSFEEIFFSDENHGWVSFNETFSGKKNHILYTTNGGKNWQKQVVDSEDDVTNIFFLDNDNGFVTTNSEIFKTDDGGVNWQKKTLEHLGELKIDFKDNDTGYVYNEFGVIYKTINKGKDWVKINDGYSEHMNNMHIFSDDHILGVGNNTIIEWENNIWTKKNTSYDQYDIIFLNDDLGYSCGYQDKILKTTDGGESWTEEILNGSSSTYLFSMSVVDGNNIMAAGDKGKVYRYDGSSWFNENTGFNQQIFNIFMIDEDIAWGTSFGGKLLMYDNRKTLSTDRVDIEKGKSIDFKYEIVNLNLNIKFNDLKPSSISVYTLEGKSIINDKYVVNKISYDVSNYIGQVLIFVFKNKGKSFFRKILVD